MFPFNHRAPLGSLPRARSGGIKRSVSDQRSLEENPNQSPLRFISCSFAFTPHHSYRCSPSLIAEDRRTKTRGEEISLGRVGSQIPTLFICTKLQFSKGRRREAKALHEHRALRWLWLQPHQHGRQQLKNKLTASLSAFLTRAV